MANYNDDNQDLPILTENEAQSDSQEAEYQAQEGDLNSDNASALQDLKVESPDASSDQQINSNKYSDYAHFVKSFRDLVFDSRAKNEESFNTNNDLLQAVASMQDVIDEQEERIENLNKTKQDLDEQIAQKEDHLTELEQQVEEKESKLDDLNSAFADSCEQYKDDITAIIKSLDQQVFSQLFTPSSVNSVSPNVVVNAQNESNPLSALPYVTSNILANRKKLNDPKVLIEKVQSYLKEVSGREYSFNIVANLLICLSLSPITIFAGQAGSGKTTLCNLLAAALGLRRNDACNRFCEVAVEPNWTSNNDLVGYYNPVTRQIEKSNAQLFNALATLDKEAKFCKENKSACDKIAPYFILLDDANTSNIDHYFSQFFKLCDLNSLSPRTISLGGEHELLIPEQVRFLATINSSDDSYKLSERLLDRSFVYLLPNSRVTNDSIFPIAFEQMQSNAPNIVPYGVLQDVFINSIKNLDLCTEVEEKWNAIKQIFNECKYKKYLSARTQKLVQAYCLASIGCLKTNNPLQALDFAIAQKVLPMLNGSAEQLDALMERLRDTCTAESMPKSNKHLERMMNNKQTSYSYNFFDL